MSEHNKIAEMLEAAGMPSRYAQQFSATVSKFFHDENLAGPIEKYSPADLVFREQSDGGWVVSRVLERADLSEPLLSIQGGAHWSGTPPPEDTGKIIRYSDLVAKG